MGIFAVVLIVLALLLIAGAEWPRLSGRLGTDARTSRSRRRRKERLRVIEGESEPDDFAASVQRDLESLPVIEEHDGRPRR